MHWLNRNSKKNAGCQVSMVFQVYNTKYCTVRLTATSLYTPESRPQTIFCMCLVNGYFYRTMQQWDFQKQAHVDLLQALFIPARGFSRSYRLKNAWLSSEETALGTGTNYLGI